MFYVVNGRGKGILKVIFVIGSIDCLSHCFELLLFQLLSHVQFFCDPMDYSPPGSSVHGILQARILEWVAISFPRDLPDPGIKLGSPALQEDSSPSEPPGKPSPLLVGLNSTIYTDKGGKCRPHHIIIPSSDFLKALFLQKELIGKILSQAKSVPFLHRWIHR